MGVATDDRLEEQTGLVLVCDVLRPLGISRASLGGDWAAAVLDCPMCGWRMIISVLVCTASSAVLTGRGQPIAIGVLSPYSQPAVEIYAAINDVQMAAGCFCARTFDNAVCFACFACSLHGCTSHGRIGANISVPLRNQAACGLA